MIQTQHLRFRVAVQSAGDRLALLLHGFPDSPYAYRHQMPVLSALGYRVWAPELRGYGKSDRPAERSAYSLDKLVTDVADQVKASGARTVLLVGHDWGGLIAWRCAMEDTLPIERMVVMNAPHPARFRRGLRHPAQLLRSSYMLFLRLPRVPERLLMQDDCAPIRDLFRQQAVHKERFSDDDLEVFRQNAREPGALTAMLNYYRAPHPPAYRKGMMPPVIRIPTLMIWGEQDVAMRKELSYGTERYVSDLTRHYIPDASHFVQQDTPEAVNAVRVLAAHAFSPPLKQGTFRHSGVPRALGSPPRFTKLRGT